MGIVLGPNQYGKAENRVVRIYRESERHEIRDVNVSTSLRGDFSAAHLTGDQADVLPTDTQKQTCYAYAKEKGIGDIETYGLDLARHFVDDIEPVTGARVEVEEYDWERVNNPNHTWVKKGQEVRRTVVTVDGKGDGQRVWIVSGFKDLVLLKSTGSQFWGYHEDKYTVLKPTTDRVMSTSLVAWWRYNTTDLDFGGVYDDVKRLMLQAYADVESLALQQTLYEMGRAALEAHDEIAEVKLSAPNIHHFVYDLSPFGLENNNEVFHADDRPYGLIQATIQRDDEDSGAADNADPGLAWYTVPAFA
jgi:urate oxidase